VCFHRNLIDAIDEIDDWIIEGTSDNLPPYTPPSFPVPAAERVTLFDWMVLTCYPDELARQQYEEDLANLAANMQQEIDDDEEGPGAAATMVPGQWVPIGTAPSYQVAQETTTGMRID
jgi:beta-1,4-N-acetylglucosaminyltransferase